MAFCPANQQSWLYTPQLSMMPCVSTTIGNHHAHQATVSAVVHATLTMHSPGQQELSNFIANLLTKSVSMSALNNSLLSHATANSEDGAKVEVTQGFWGDHHQPTFFDVQLNKQGNIS